MPTPRFTPQRVAVYRCTAAPPPEAATRAGIHPEEIERAVALAAEIESLTPRLPASL